MTKPHRLRWLCSGPHGMRLQLVLFFNCANCAHLMCWFIWFWFCDFYKQESTGFAQILVLQNPRTHIIWGAHVRTNPTMSNFEKLRVEHFRTRSATLIHSGIMNGSYSKQLCRQLSQMCKIHAPRHTKANQNLNKYPPHPDRKPTKTQSKTIQKPTETRTHQNENQPTQIPQTHENIWKPYHTATETPKSQASTSARELCRRLRRKAATCKVWKCSKGCWW